MDTSSEGPNWGDIAGVVASQFGLQTLRSPTLKTTIEQGVHFIVVDDSARELVFDMRALFLGLLAAGEPNPSSISYGNTASWLVEWFSERTGPVVSFVATQAQAEPKQVGQAFGQKYRVTLSRSVVGLIKPAATIAQLTVNRPEFEARHLVAAMINDGKITEQALQLFKASLSPDAIDSLKRTLVDRIMRTPEPGESRETWHAALGLPLLPGPESPRQRKRPPDGVAAFNSDVVGDTDVLETSADARTLARLICLENAAPLAVAIFGGWGSGKSTFMNRIDQEVRAITFAESERQKAGADGANGAARFVRRVVQIRFNAWQFVDANLWTSLTAEFFDQLRAGGWDRIGTARHADLVERVNRHVHSLNSEAEARRKAAVRGGKDVADAQLRRDEAAHQVDTARSGALGQAAIDLLSEVYESQKANMATLGLAVTGTDTSKAVDTIVSTVDASRTALGQARAVGRIVGKAPKRFLIAGVCVLAFIVIGVAGYFGLRSVQWQQSGAIVAGLMAIAGLGTIAKAFQPALAIVASVTKKSLTIAHSVQAAEQTALKNLLQAELKLREAAAEAEALQAAADLASQRLSRYVDPKATSNPPRLLRYVLEDDPNTKALEAEVGLIGRTRRLFQAVNDIVKDERGKSGGDQADSDVPERIILYIDDLDRCTQQQVYSVLQAIHLLLAFELFVVVVAVDVEWVQSALARSIQGKESQRASRYLEKIFQIAFWLNPLSSTGEDGGSFARYVRSLSQQMPAGPAVKPKGEEPLQPLPGKPRLEPEGPNATARKDELPKEPVTTPGQEAIKQAIQAIATIQLEQVEIDFLASPTIARIASATPRAVKRFLNIYRLVRTRLSEGGVAIVKDETDPPAYPIIAFAVAIETGQPAEVARAFYEMLLRHNDGDGLQPLLEPGGEMDNAAIQAGCRQVLRLRGNQLTVGNVLEIVRVTRRYSFNQYY